MSGKYFVLCACSSVSQCCVLSLSGGAVVRLAGELSLIDQDKTLKH